jgi:hypothetical protein
MNDISYVAIIVAFFALAALLVKACDRIIGPDEKSEATGATISTDDAPQRAA